MIYNTIRIDLDGQKDIQGPSLTSGDVGYGLILEFYKSGKLYDITGYNILIWAKLKGLDSPIPDVGKVANGKGYYTIKPSMYVYGGDTYLEITLTDNTGSHIVTKVLHCPVRSGFSAGQTIGEEDYSVLATSINKAQVATTNANNAADYINAIGDKFDYATRSATLKIAASNATEKSKAAADYVCDGVDDEVELNAAVQALPVGGGSIELSEGLFTLNSALSFSEGIIALTGQGGATIVNATSSYGLRSSGVDTVVYMSNLVCSALNYGFYASGKFSAYNCKFSGNLRGLQLSSSAVDCKILNCDITSPNVGLSVYGGKAVISGCNIEGGASGLDTDAGAKVVLVGNTISSIALSGSANFPSTAAAIADINDTPVENIEIY